MSNDHRIHQTLIRTISTICMLLGFAAGGCVTTLASDDDEGRSVFYGCSGTYDCHVIRYPELTTTFTLSRRADGCYADDEKLDADEFSVRGDRDAFRLCGPDGNACLACVRHPDGNGAGSSCTGVASSCSSLGGTSCAYQLGCRVTLGPTYSTNDDGCSGHPRECAEISSQESCELQSGCRWIGAD